MPADGQIFELCADEELRIEVECADPEEMVGVELKSGTAEIFGTEMVVNTRYNFKQGAKIAVFTFHGCQILVLGKLEMQPYTSAETPMIMYLNIHAALEGLRKVAEEAPVPPAAAAGQETVKGPITMIVGPTDCGKSTLAKLLLNYASRMERKPIYVDLDVGQGSISVPGTIGAVLVERVASIEDGGFSEAAPLVYNYGHKTPGANPVLYNKQVSRLADVVRGRTSASRKARDSGLIINTCGWVRGEGYNQIKHIAMAFEADVILVLDQERVYNELVRDMPSFVKVVWLPKSGGVVTRTQDQRAVARDARVKRYFYGNDHKLFPHTFDVKFADLKDKIYKIGAPALPDSCMPIGMKQEDNQTKLVAVTPNPRDLVNHLLAVSFTSKMEELIVTNVAGFVLVTDVNVEEQKVTLLSPQPKPLPDTLLLLSDIVYVDGT